MISLDTFDVLCASQDMDVILEPLAFSEGLVGRDTCPGDQTVEQTTFFLCARNLDVLDGPTTSGSLDLGRDIRRGLEEFLDVGIKSRNVTFTVIGREVCVENFSRTTLGPGVDWKWVEMYMIQCWGAGQVF